AGAIYQADTVTVGSGVAFWDGNAWHGMGDFYIGALNNEVYDVEVYKGDLYAAGIFRSHSGSPAHFSNFARWNGLSWEAAGGSPNGMVKALHVHDGMLI